MHSQKINGKLPRISRMLQFIATYFAELKYLVTYVYKKRWNKSDSEGELNTRKIKVY